MEKKKPKPKDWWPSVQVDATTEPPDKVTNIVIKNVKAWRGVWIGVDNEGKAQAENIELIKGATAKGWTSHVEKGKGTPKMSISFYPKGSWGRFVKWSLNPALKEVFRVEITIECQYENAKNKTVTLEIKNWVKE